MFSDNVTCLVRDRIRCRCRWGSPRPARRRTLGIDVALNRISTDTQLPCHRSNGHALKLGLLHSVPPSLLKKRRLPPPKAQPCSPCPTRLYPYSIPAPRCFATRPSGKPKSCWSARYWLPGQQWNGLCPAGADIGGHLAVDHGTPPRAAVVDHQVNLQETRWRRWLPAVVDAPEGPDPGGHGAPWTPPDGVMPPSAACR